MKGADLKTAFRVIVTIACPLAIAVSGCNAAVPATMATALTDASTQRARAASGVVYTLAGSGRAASVDGEGRHASFVHPAGITIDSTKGLLYVLEPSTPSVRTLTTHGLAGTLTRDLSDPSTLTFGSRGARLYVGDKMANAVFTVTRKGIVSLFARLPATSEPPPAQIGQMAVGRSGVLNITESRSGDLVLISPAKKIVTNRIGPGAFAVCVRADDVYVVNQVAGELGKVIRGGQTDFAASPLLRYATAMTFDPDNGSFYLVDPTHNRILTARSDEVEIFAGDGKPGEANGALKVAEFNSPSGIVYDASTHALYVTDAGGNTVRAIRGFE